MKKQKAFRPRLDVALIKQNRARMRSYPSKDYDWELKMTPRYMVTHYNHYNGTTTVDPWLSYSGPSVYSSASMATLSVNTPGWPRVRHKPDNPFHRAKYQRSDPIGRLIVEWIRREDVIQDFPGALHQVDVYEGTAASFGVQLQKGVRADNPSPGCISKLLSNLQSAKANTAVAMAELNKTAAHVTKTARKLGNAYLALKHLRFRDFARELGLVEQVAVDIRRKYKFASRKTMSLTYASTRTGAKSRLGSFASETWLEYSYAWKPLLKDVYDHADALAQTVVERQGVMREAKATNKTMKDDAYIVKVPNNTIDYEVKTKDRQWQAMEVRYSVPPGTVPAVRAFGLVNPLEVAWELVPFSFVADWFLPIGDAIRNLTSTVGLTFHSGWVSTKLLHTLESSVYGHGRTYTSGSLRAVTSGRLTASIQWFDQYRGQLLEFPTPQFPEWKDPRGVHHKGGPDESSGTTALKDMSHGLSAIALLKTIFLDKGSGRNLR